MTDREVGADEVGKAGDAGEVGAEVVGDGRVARTPRRWPLVVLTVLVLLALLGRWADDLQRKHEFAGLLAATVSAQSSAIDARQKVLSTREYTMPLLVSSSSATVRAGLEQLIEQSAAQGQTELQSARSAIVNVVVLPWHKQLRLAQRTDVAYLDQRIADFGQVAHGDDLTLLASSQATTAALVATTAMEAAAPTTADSDRAAAALAAAS